MDHVDAPAEPELLASARQGDSAAFERLLAGYRGELYAHCRFRLGAINVLRLRAGRIVEIAGFLDPAVHRRFGLPEELPDPG